MAKRRMRRFLIVAATGLVALFLLYAFWPRALAVDMAAVKREPMIETVDEEAKTRVRDEYVVSAPVSGRLLRVDVESGDKVEAGNTVVARMTPGDPSFLDQRAQAEAEAAVKSAEAALRFAQSAFDAAKATEAYAQSEAGRARALAKEGTIAKASLDRAEVNLTTARADRRTAEEAVRMRAADLAAARARLLPPEDRIDPPGDPGAPQTIAIRSPVSGEVLQVMHKSEIVLAAGAPIVSVGDPANDLEIVAELLSSDAVQVKNGDSVLIENWGGSEALHGVVRRVEPYGFTKISALGVEEQRVNVVIDFTGPKEKRTSLGHGYRVDVRIIVWNDENALVAPSSAVFRDQGKWAVFAVDKGRAKRRIVEVGRNNGVQAEILAGLEAGDVVVEYPGDQISNGVRVAKRAAAQ